MGRRKKQQKLEQQLNPSVAYRMARPNDDMHAYGWDLRHVRQPIQDGNEIDKGPPLFEVKQPLEIRLQYGMDLNFLDANFINMRLSQSPMVIAALTEAKNTKYHPDSRVAVEAAVKKAFETLIMPEIEKRFQRVVPILAQFLCAREAHRSRYGVD